MPELAEVTLSKQAWIPAKNEYVQSIQINDKARIFQNTTTTLLSSLLTKKPFLHARTHGKRLFFQFGSKGVLEIHLGMSGRLSSRPLNSSKERHDHLILFMESCQLVLNDYRMFGLVRWLDEPAPWESLPLEILDQRFSPSYLSNQLQSKQRSSLKSILLNQRFCPGIGNWMADEICWRMKTFPGTHVSDCCLYSLWRELRFVSSGALYYIAHPHNLDPSKGFAAGHYVSHVPPVSWLFQHRWKQGGSCPRCHHLLQKKSIAGRSTAWCPHCQT